MLLAGAIVGFMGLAVLGVFAWVRSVHRRLLAHGVRRVGQAVAVTDSDNDVSLVVTFADETGAVHTVTSQGSNSSWASRDTQQMDVLYHPGRPQKARIETDLVFQQRLSLWLGGAATVTGAVLLVLALL